MVSAHHQLHVSIHFASNVIVLCNVFQDEKEAVYHTTNHKVCAYTVWSTVCAVLTALCIIVHFQQSLSPPQATESTGATGGGEYSALQHGQGQGKGGRDKGRGQPSSTTKQVNIVSTSEYIQL